MKEKTETVCSVYGVLEERFSTPMSIASARSGVLARWRFTPMDQSVQEPG